MNAVTAVSQQDKLEANKRVIQRYLDEIFNEKKYDVIDELVHRDFRCDPPSFPEPWDFNSYKEGVPAFLSSFSEYHWVTEDMVAEDDKVAVIFRFRGTLADESIPENERGLRFTVMGIYYLSDGQIIDVKKLNVDATLDFYTAMGLPRPKN
jgi:predicted ester cyclase